MVQCYYKDHYSGKISSENAAVCYNPDSNDGYYSCCFSWGICLPNALCLYPEGVPAFTTGMCTDPSLNSDACSDSCSTYGNVVYNGTTESWGCCEVTCVNDTYASFNAPNPTTLLASTMNQLLYIPSGTHTPTFSSTSVSASSTSASSTTNSAATSSNNPSASATGSQSTTPLQSTQNKSSLSAGAGVGIGIGATFLLAIMILGIFLLIRRSKKSKLPPQQPAPAEKDGIHTDAGYSGHTQGKDQYNNAPYEMQRPPYEEPKRPSELGSYGTRPELEAPHRT